MSGLQPKKDFCNVLLFQMICTKYSRTYSTSKPLLLNSDQFVYCLKSETEVIQFFTSFIEEIVFLKKKKSLLLIDFQFIHKC